MKKKLLDREWSCSLGRWSAPVPWGFALTDREAGGKDGGGSRLTPQAKGLIEAYVGFKQDAEEQLDQLFAQYFSEETVEKIKEME